MFTQSADFYDHFYGWKDYASESQRLTRLIRRMAPGARTLLDVACGTGRHLETLRRKFEVEGLEIDEKLLAVAKRRLKDVPLHLGNMMSFDLGTRFDVVTCLFYSVTWVKTVENMRRAVRSMAAHLNPGGILIVEPWWSAEGWIDNYVSAIAVNKESFHGTRVGVSGRRADLATFDFYYYIASNGGVRVLSERHEVGLFSAADYESAIGECDLIYRYQREGLTGFGLHCGTQLGGPKRLSFFNS